MKFVLNIFMVPIIMFGLLSKTAFGVDGYCGEYKFDRKWLFFDTLNAPDYLYENKATHDEADESKHGRLVNGRVWKCDVDWCPDGTLVVATNEVVYKKKTLNIAQGKVQMYMCSAGPSGDIWKPASPTTIEKCNANDKTEQVSPSVVASAPSDREYYKVSHKAPVVYCYTETETPNSQEEQEEDEEDKNPLPPSNVDPYQELIDKIQHQIDDLKQRCFQ